MDSDTRTRLLRTAATLFADHGYRGASVRRICDVARANPGAVSYHFGGKKQLYRTVLRRAASVLTEVPASGKPDEQVQAPLGIAEAIALVLQRMDENPNETRLLLRDLADGGDVAVEALEPAVRAAFEQLRLTVGEEAAPRRSSPARALFLDLAAPLVLLTAAWPVLQRPLELDAEQRQALLVAACRRALEAHGHGDLSF